MPNKPKIFVTKAFLPPLEEYTEQLKGVWDRRWLTNHGKLAQELEARLRKYFKVKHALFVANGTLALQLAIKGLDIKGEVITTPFTFAATTTSILWENCKPVFVDINPNDFSIDVTKIEKAITKNTKAILAVHVYGYPCDVKEIERIAKKHNLKVIYDAAHAFGVKINGRSIMHFGDVSTLSFHATKLFHTVEGGMIMTNDDAVAKKIKEMRDFGLDGLDIVRPGINAKNSEFHAAMGLVNLKYVDAIKEVRSGVIEEYKKLLQGTGLHEVKYSEDVSYNSAYFPVIFESEEKLLTVKKALEKENIFPRRYFYPSLNTLSFVKYVPCPVSESIAKRVLCLPVYHDLTLTIVREIVKIIKKALLEEKPTVTIGIPAYNESGNIAKLLRSLPTQHNNNYILKEIIVNSDASADDTVAIVKKIAKTNKKIKLIENSTRRGKTTRLNEIYKLNKSDFLLTLDADIRLIDRDFIDKLINVLTHDEKALVVAGNFIPAKPKTFVGKTIYANNILWNNIREDINGGDHIANLYGGASMLTRKFSKSFIYPTNISCDEEYLYIKAKEKNGFRFLKGAKVLFKAPETTTDVIKQGKRFLNERNLLIKYFGDDIVDAHEIPIIYKAKGMIATLLSNPNYLLLAVFMNFLIKILPYSEELNSKGMWDIATSTKSFTN